MKGVTHRLLQDVQQQRMHLKEKVKCGMVKLTGCSKMFHGRDPQDTEEKVRQGKVRQDMFKGETVVSVAGCSKMFFGSERLDTSRVTLSPVTSSQVLLYSIQWKM